MTERQNELHDRIRKLEETKKREEVAGSEKKELKKITKDKIDRLAALDWLYGKQIKRRGKGDRSDRRWLNDWRRVTKLLGNENLEEMIALWIKVSERIL